MAYTAVDTWDLSPDRFPAKVRVLRRGVQTPVNGGMVQRRQTFSSQSAQGQAAVRQFTVMFVNATKADYNRIIELWKKTDGGAQGISYSTGDLAYAASQTIIVRMVAAPLAVSKTAHGQYQFTVVLEEMLHAPG